MQTTHSLPIRSAYNFRDLGGYAGAGGRIVRWRTLLRSGDFHELADDDASFLASIPLRTIVDFRSTDEVRLLPDHPIDGAEKRLNLPIEAGNLVPDLKRIIDDKGIDDNERVRQGTALMRNMYLRFATDHLDAFGTLFELLQSGEAHPLLFHCTAGKDRTGAAAALVLTSLGVDRETVFEDYLMTNSALKGKYDHLDHIGPIALLFKTVRREFLQEFLAATEAECGTAERFLEEKLGVDLHRMQSLYLT